MENILLYLLKAHVVLALFAAAYYGLLRRLTFFQLNRAYLLFALLFAAVYPALPVPGLLPAEAPTAPAVAWVLADASATSPAVDLPLATPGPNWLLVVLGLYASGVAVLLGRLLVQLLALARLRRATRPATTPGGVPYRQLPGPGDPFSFGRTIYLYPGQHTAAEVAVVVAHEQAHVRQGHTLDVLLAHLGTALFWPSPAAWLLRRAVLDNLEYLADAATLRTGLDRRAYQYCLLQLSRGTVGPALALPFTFFTLKNRVAMMNTPLSSRGQLARYFLAGPLVLLAAIGYSAAHAREAAPTELDLASLANPSAVALNDAMVPATSPASLPVAVPEKPAAPQKPASVLPPAARNYLTSAYSQAKITEVVVGSFTPNGPTVYVVALKQQQQTVGLSFDAAGQFLGKMGNSYRLYKTTGYFALPARPPKPTATPPAASPPAPAGAVQTGPAPLYYLDGQMITEAQFKAVNPNDIASIQILKGEQARQMAGDKGRDGILVVTTEANKNIAAVLAFNQRVQRYAPLQAEPSKPPVAFALPADALFYLDGKPSTKQAIEQLDQQSIAHVETLKDQTRIRRLPGLADSPAISVILITTKANADAPAVRAFADQADLASAYTSRPVSVNVLRPAALAYITSHYPNARLNEVHELKQKTSGALKYQVQLINGKRPFYVYFTQEGEFAGE
jgi:Zn-dependent protease with chaperone function